MTVIDQIARERAASEVERSVAVSAGAGTGKTTVLVRRLVAHLQAGTPPGRLAAVTFTEKAAGEIQHRVRDRLEEAVEVHAELAPQLDAFHELTLSTVHGFCQRLLQAQALEADWAPGTSVGDGVFHDPEVHAALRAWRAGFARRHPALVPYVDATLSAWHLRDAATKLLTYRDLEPLVSEMPFDVATAREELVEIRERFEDAAALCLRPESDKLLANNASFRDLLRRVAREADPDRAVRVALYAGVKGNRSGGRAADWDGDGRELLKEAVVVFERWKEQRFVTLHGAVIGDMAEHLLPAVSEAKRQGGVADFDDLVFRAGALLRDDPSVRAHLADRYDAILVDEVQDTDPLQAEVAALLTRDPDATGPWTAEPPRPGRLFVVGDPKQSIYRFRRADVATWAEIRDLVTTDGDRHDLRQNFRSVPGLVHWANHVFAEMPDYLQLDPHRQGAELDPVVVVRTERDDEIADVIAHLCEQVGRAGVLDPHDEVLRPLRWGDVMVLLPAWTAAPDVVEGFARVGVETVVEGGKTFFETDEVRACMAALRALSEPGDSEAVVVALRGLFGFPLADLAAHVAAEGSWRYTLPQARGPVGAALAVLAELRRGHGRRSWVATLDDVLEASRAPAVWALTARGHPALANLDKLRTLVRELERDGRSHLQVVEQLQALSRGSEEELSRADPDTDAVRVTTLFKAKGLEAPVVVLACARRSASGVGAAVDRQAGTVGIKVGPLQPQEWEALNQAEKAELERERQRWMYVGCTRARDQLVIADRADANLLAWVAAGLAREVEVEDEAMVEVGVGARVRVRVGSQIPRPLVVDEVFPGLDAAVDQALAAPAYGDRVGEERAAEAQAGVHAAKRASTRWRSVQALAAGKRGHGTGTGVGVRGGSVVHAVMERLDLSEEGPALATRAQALVRRIGARERLEPEVIEACGAVLAQLLAHPVVAEARAAPERWQEVPFAYHERGTVVSGAIDLCFPTDATRRSWVVVDWKSDTPPEGSPLREVYETQLAYYAKALIATVAPCESVRTVLVGPFEALPVDLETAALDEVFPEARPLLERLLRDGAPVPRVGADVGDPVIGMVELAWDAAKVAVVIDSPDPEVAALRKAGWQVFEVGEADGIAEALGLTAEDEEAGE